MKNQVEIDNNESVFIGVARRGNLTDMYETTILATGEFGGGTVTIQASPDGGATKINLRDITGEVVAITAADAYNVRLGLAGKLGEELELYATMAGATAPAVTLWTFDNT